MRAAQPRFAVASASTRASGSNRVVDPDQRGVGARHRQSDLLRHPPYPCHGRVGLLGRPVRDVEREAQGCGRATHPLPRVAAPPAIIGAGRSCDPRRCEPCGGCAGAVWASGPHTGAAAAGPGLMPAEVETALRGDDRLTVQVQGCRRGCAGGGTAGCGSRDASRSARPRTAVPNVVRSPSPAESLRIGPRCVLWTADRTPQGLHESSP